MRIVFDTNVLISSTLWDNSVSHKLLLNLIEKDIKIFTSVEILNEYKNAVKRDFKYTEDEIEEIIVTLSNIFEIIKPDIKVDIVKEDPDDNKILECAVSSNANFILSYDRHLLKIKKYGNIKIMKPEEFLSGI